MTTTYAILAAIAAIVGTFLGLRHKASREHEARVEAELSRDVAKGQAEVATAQAAVVAEVSERKDAAVEIGADYRAEVAARAAELHAQAVAETPPAGVVASGPTPAEVVRAADEARRNARTRAKIAAGRKGGK